MQRSILLAAVAALILLSPLAYPAYTSTNLLLTSGISTCTASASSSSITSCVGSIYSQFLSLVMVGILLSFAIISLAYIASQLLGISKLQGWYKGELYETIKTLIIIGSIISLLTIMSGISLTLAGGTQSTAGTATSRLISNFGGLWTTAYNNYITPTSSNTLLATYAVGGIAAGVGALKSVGFGLTDYVSVIVSLQSGSEGKLYTSSILESSKGAFSFLGDLLYIVIIPVDLLFGLLSYSFYIIVGVGLIAFIPIGVVLRAIPTLRGLGGTFIAMGIGFCLVYPSLLVLVNLPITNYFNNVLYPPQPSAKGSWSAILNYIINIIEGLVNALSGFLGYFVGFFTPPIFGIFPVLNMSIYYAVSDVVQFILIVVDLIIGITITDNIAKILGGSVKLGIGKFTIA